MISTSPFKISHTRIIIGISPIDFSIDCLGIPFTLQPTLTVQAPLYVPARYLKKKFYKYSKLRNQLEAKVNSLPFDILLDRSSYCVQ